MLVKSIEVLQKMITSGHYRMTILSKFESSEDCKEVNATIAKWMIPKSDFELDLDDAIARGLKESLQKFQETFRNALLTNRVVPTE
jgi:hypothetical protein